MKAKPHPSQATLKEYFEVVDGKFIRKIRTSNTTKIGEVVEGYVLGNGRRFMKFQGEHFAYHRLIWIFFNGEIPPNHEIDYIDCDYLNNVVSNLHGEFGRLI